MKHVPVQHPSNEDLFAYRDGELSGEKRFLIEAHVVSCATCRELVDGMSGIEADLRSRPDDVGEEYYARLTDSVLGKIGARSGAKTGAKSEARARPAAEDVPRVERRRPDSMDDAEGPRRRRFFPWFGVVGAGAAAASVLVVVVMLAQRQGEWIRAPRPASTGAPEEPLTVRGDSALNQPAETGEGKLTGEKVKSDLRARSAKEAAGEEDLGARAKQNLGTVRQEAEEKNAMTTPAADEVANKKLELQKDASGMAARAARTPVAEQAPPAAGVVAGLDERAAGAAGAAATPSADYAAVLRAHGLPPVYDPARVDRDALLKAETDLRYLYMAGRAETDSARVRLYIAEIARAKVDRADSAAVEGVIHHYWRAIRLSRDDAAVASMARRRLADFLREVGREP